MEASLRQHRVIGDRAVRGNAQSFAKARESLIALPFREEFQTEPVKTVGRFVLASRLRPGRASRQRNRKERQDQEEPEAKGLMDRTAR